MSRRQRGQCRHVGRGLHRRPRADERPDVHGDDPGHQDEPRQRQPDQGGPALLRRPPLE
jgi:hypothetical protein